MGATVFDVLSEENNKNPSSKTQKSRIWDTHTFRKSYIGLFTFWRGAVKDARFCEQQRSCVCLFLFQSTVQVQIMALRYCVHVFLSNVQVATDVLQQFEHALAHFLGTSGGFVTMGGC